MSKVESALVFTGRSMGVECNVVRVGGAYMVVWTYDDGGTSAISLSEDERISMEKALNACLGNLDA